MPADEANSLPSASLPTYRHPRRRPAHLRTKTGCLTCRGRKKKCDETRIKCRNCTSLRLACRWQSSPDQSEHQARSVSPFPTGQIVNSHDLDSISRGKIHSSQLSVVHHLPWTHSAVIKRESAPLFDFLRSTFLPQLIRPSTDGAVTDELNRETMLLALRHPFCMHALLACCGAEMPTTDVQSFHQLARFHYTQAVSGLRVALDSNNLEHRWVVSMLTIMMLCIYERAKPTGSPGVEIHLAGAARLIAFCSVDSPSLGDERFQEATTQGAMHRLVRESFIFHVATSLPFQQGDAHHIEIEEALSIAEQAISQHFRPNLLSHSDSPVLGFPPQLYRCIYTVYRLYQSSGSQLVSLEICRALDHDLKQWDQRIKPYARKLPEKGASPGRDLDSNGLQSTPIIPVGVKEPNDSCVGPKLYILGCRLLLRRMQGSRLSPTIDQLLPEGMDMVRQLQPDHDYYADYYCWPLLAIGMQLEFPSDRELLLHQVWSFCATTNNGTMRRVADMLKFFWR